MMSSAEQSELSLFLEDCKSKLFGINSVEAVHVVIGNEACDLDSVVSALVYAYFLYQKNKTGRCLFVPVLNIPSSKYRLTGEVQFVLGQHNITGEQLMFRDDINLEELHEQHRLQLTLVDHNVLRGKDERLASAVCRVIDHHKNEREETPSVSCYIEPVGSCCTLVAETILRDPDVSIPKELVSLLHATILLDTVCLTESAGRTTTKDIEIVDKLEVILGKVDRKKIFDQLQAAKMDVSGLSVKEILSKDVKIISSHHITVSISSVPKSLKELFDEDQADSILSEFSSQQGAAVVVIMALYLDQQREPHRELAVYSEDSLLKDKVSSYLNQQSLDLGLVPLMASVCTHQKLTVFSQLNTKASRKVLLPLLVHWLDTL